MGNLVSTNNVLERIEELCNEPLYAGLNYDILNIIEEHREKCTILEQAPLTDSQIATRVRQIYLERVIKSCLIACFQLTVMEFRLISRLLKIN